MVVPVLFLLIYGVVPLQRSGIADASRPLSVQPLPNVVTVVRSKYRRVGSVRRGKEKPVAAIRLAARVVYPCPPTGAMETLAPPPFHSQPLWLQELT